MSSSLIVLESYVVIVILVFGLGVALDVDMRNLIELLAIIHVAILIAAAVAHFVLHVI